VTSRTAAWGRQSVHVAVLMETHRPVADRRRLLLVQDSRRKSLVRTPFAVQQRVETSQTVVNYLTPDRRYTYRRIKQTP